MKKTNAALSAFFLCCLSTLANAADPGARQNDQSSSIKEKSPASEPAEQGLDETQRKRLREWASKDIQRHTVRLTEHPLPLAEEWPTSGPAEQGLDAAQLDELREELAQEEQIHSVLIARHGKLVFEYYGKARGPEDLHYVNSVTKSFTSALVGIALKEGKLRSLDQPLSDFFPEASEPGVDPRVKNITLAQLLAMSSGLDWDEDTWIGQLHRCIWKETKENALDAECKKVYSIMENVRATLKQPLAHPAGEVFNYSTRDSHLLGTAVARASGVSEAKYLEEKLFKPLGVPRYYWWKTPEGEQPGGRALWLRSRDMLKFGQLYLQGGMWQGQQLVPADYVKASTTQKIGISWKCEADNPRCEDGRYDASWANVYGYQWWLSPAGESFRALGYGEQTIEVFPALDAVLVMTVGDGGLDPAKTNTSGDWNWNRNFVKKYLMGALL